MMRSKNVRQSQEGLTEAQKKWMELKFGARFTFGINTFYNVESSDGSLDPSIITLEELDVDEWVDTAINAGMRYCIFTAKNHDGFCNWNTQYSYYNIMNTPFNRDILQILADTCAKNGLKLGLYYSLLDYYISYYNNDRRFVKQMYLQLEELMNNYGDIVEFWFDGFWEKQTSGWDLAPTDFVQAWRNEGAFRLKMDYMYNSIKKWQPECIVVNHSTTDFVGIPLHPVDARVGVNISYVIVDKKFWSWLGKESYFPLEITMNLSGKDFGKFNPGNWYWHEEDETGPEKERIYRWLEIAERHDANLVLNCSVSPEGKLRAVDKLLLDSIWH
jgi:alpha-L-fucosidase